LTGDAAEAAQHISELAARLQRVADGDLTVTFPDQSVLSLAARRVTESMLALVDRVAHAAAKVQDDAHHVLETALDVEASAQEQSLNVDESRRTMQGLRQCSSEINSESRELASASEDVLSVTENTASQISQLVEHQVQIEELLDTVREIAERSDILALNASLEGVRAGEAGRGFSLVAAEMRRMAEKVKSAANDIRQTVSNVRSSARATMMGIEEGRRVGDRMKKSVERILLMAMQQQSSTAQVNNNMSDVASYLQDATGDTARARELAESLTNRASSLLELVEQWNLPEAEDWGQTGSLGGVEFDSDDNIIFRPSGRQAATDPTTARATAASSSDDASGSPDPATPPDAQPE
ncbi:MAG: methyl-accepting chemotaxis protein, partial [Planctomycetota bacterium]